jgi:hypothetical protein
MRSNPPGGRRRPGQASATDSQDVHSRTMWLLRAGIGLLTALLLASVAHAIADGLTPGLTLGLALTTGLLLAFLRLWRDGPPRKP